MQTDLPAGTVFRWRYKGEWSYGRIEPDRRTYLLIAKPETEGLPVVTCVWRGDRLIKKGS